MPSPTLLLSKLDAVNMMLASIGQAPVNSLAVSSIRDVNIAVLALDNTTREVLTHGWSFNTDEDYELVPGVGGKIAVPAGALFIDATRQLHNIVPRWDGTGMVLYDRENRTFDLSRLNPLRVDVVWGYEFDQIPQHARHYIATKAARLFQSQVIGSDILFKFTELHEQEAYAALNRLEGRQKDKNIFRSGADVNRIFDRMSNPVRY